MIVMYNMIMYEKQFILNTPNYHGANSVITTATLYSHITGAHVKFHSVAVKSVESLTSAIAPNEIVNKLIRFFLPTSITG
jgi:hypothetical protein